MNADFFTAISAINDEDDYVKAGNYWRWLKRKLSGDGVQLVSALTTSSLRLRTVDRKRAKLSGETAPGADGGAARKVPYILIVAVISSSKLRSRSR